ncbi:MAG: hypothetical protein ACD_66C00083G0002 [uncultured bacterium]|nr:MAG: hypothetical protein ACD_66C00083G0002 [uncultured bacterium]
MNIGDKDLNSKFEKAIRLLVQYVPEDQGREKSLIAHVLRVGVYLYRNDYSKDVVLAGVLHDSIEWTNISEEIIKNEFGQHVLDIILANTKDRTIKNKGERRNDMVARCVQVGKDALIVKAADTLDSYAFYQSTNNPDEIQRAVDIAKLILNAVPEDVQDPIFDSLKNLN